MGVGRYVHKWKLVCFSCRTYVIRKNSDAICPRCFEDMTALKFKVKFMPKDTDIKGWEIVRFNHEQYLNRIEIRAEKRTMKILKR